MNNSNYKYNQNSNPDDEGTPSAASGNGQLQWILGAIEQLKANSNSLHDKLDAHVKSVNEKLDVGINSVNEKITDKNKIIEDKLEHKFEVLDMKITNAHKAIDDTHRFTCEKIENVKPTIINKIHEEQRVSNRWIIGLLAATFMGVLGIIIRFVFK